MSHDIIDNRNSKLVDHINRILESTAAARFAVGYFFLSGLESIAEKLAGVGEIRLLIGNTTNRETLEQLVEGYRRLELVQEAEEEQRYVRKAESRRMAGETAENVRSAMELMDQTDETEALVKTLVQMVEQGRLKVKVYTKGRMHAKAYIFDYRSDGRYEKGLAIVGSSNLTLAGITHNTELNVVVHGEGNHTVLVKWFDDLWADAEDFDESLMQEMKESWAVATVRPYDIYLKTLYSLVRDRLEDEDEQNVLWDDEITTKLADFQKSAVRQTVQNIRKFGGAFVSDVVGLGKSFVGAAIVKHFERTEHARPLIICPAPLKEMWEEYDYRFQLHARVLSAGYLREIGDGEFDVLQSDPKFKDCDFLLLDESHHFRYANTQRYKILQNFLRTGHRCCFLTATPRNKSAWDIYGQIKLFHQEDKTDLPVDPPDLREYFKLVEKGERNLPDLLTHILIRRRRNDVLKWYGFDSKTHQRVDPSKFDEYTSGQRRAYVIVGGRHEFFPKRELQTIEYSIEETYQGLYQDLRKFLGKPRKKLPDRPPDGELVYARYGLWHYVIKERQKQEPYATLQRAGANLRGLMRVLLFKRFESSVYAFCQTIGRLLAVHKGFVAALNDGIVPAGTDAQRILYESDFEEESDLLDALRDVSGQYNIEDFNLDLLREHLDHDIRMFERIRKLVEGISPDKDAKLQTLLDRLSQKPLRTGKRLIFTQYADTARYLYENLNPGGIADDIDVIYSGDKSKMRLVGRFAPKANKYAFPYGDCELNTVVATDVLAEGLNLQDCDKIINYDLHWNPVRLIQRFGRIDRIGSDHDIIHAFNFLPEVGIEKNLGLREKLAQRIQEIQDTIGEDAAILDPSERLNPDAMYAIYEQNTGQLGLFDEPQEEFVDLNEAAEFLRQLQKDDPEEYKRITGLRDGIRSARRNAPAQGVFVYCRAGSYQQLLFADAEGNIVSRDLQRVLAMIRCQPAIEAARLPSNYNSAVMRVKRAFAEDVKGRQASLEHSLSLSSGQKFVVRELRVAYGQTDDEERKAQINILEKAFRGTITSAVKKDLNLLRRNGMTGELLIKELGRLYHQHRMKRWQERQSGKDSDVAIPHVVCSEGLV